VISASLLDISRAVAPPNEGADMEHNPVVASNGLGDATLLSGAPPMLSASAGRDEGQSRNSGGSQ
jgi:hypothetical protein